MALCSQVKHVFVPSDSALTPDLMAPLIATLPLEIHDVMQAFLAAAFAVYTDLDFSLLEMNPFTLVAGHPFPLDLRGELDDTAQFKDFQK